MRLITSDGNGNVVSDEMIFVPDDVKDADDEVAFIRTRLATVLDKAKAIRANPGSAPDFTVAEKKVIDALVVLEFARRFR